MNGAAAVIKLSPVGNAPVTWRRYLIAMTAVTLIALLLLIGGALVSMIVACPLLRTLAITIDAWADSVQGSDTLPS
jgi:hypothetical protein